MAETASSPSFFGKGGTGSDILGYLPGISMVGGLVNSIFGESEEDIRQERKQKLLQQIQLYRAQALARAKELKSGGIKDLSSTTQTQLGRAQSDVSRRMASLGRSGDTESALLPVTSNINESGGKTMEDALKYYDTQTSNIESQYDQQALDAESDFAARPIEPSIADQLMSTGAQYLTYQQNQDYIDAYKNSYPVGSVKTIGSNSGSGIELNNLSTPSNNITTQDNGFDINNYGIKKLIDPRFLRQRPKYNFQDTATWG
jgi:hypothetical protein